MLRLFVRVGKEARQESFGFEHPELEKLLVDEQNGGAKIHFINVSRVPDDYTDVFADIEKWVIQFRRNNLRSFFFGSIGMKLKAAFSHYDLDVDPCPPEDGIVQFFFRGNSYVLRWDVAEQHYVVVLVK